MTRGLYQIFCLNYIFAYIWEDIHPFHVIVSIHNSAYKTLIHKEFRSIFKFMLLLYKQNN